MSRLCILFVILCAFGNAAGQAGKPDVAFGGKAWIKAPFFQGNAFNENAATVLPQPDGSQFVLIISTRSLLVHIKENGTLDDTYGINGYSASVNIQSAKAVQQKDGKIVVAGLTYVGATADFALARFNSDGTLDQTFDNDGSLTIDFEGRNDHLESVALQPDGKIVVGGNMLEGEGDDFAGAVLARLLENGSPDNSFSGDGQLNFNFMRIGAIAAQPDGKLVVAGSAQEQNTGSDFALARFSNNGTPDLSFHFDGRLTTDLLNGGDDGALALAIDENSKILAAGFAGKKGSGQYDFALARYNPDGTLDDSFNNDGKLSTGFGGTETARFIALQKDGKILLGGIHATANSNNTNFALARYTSGGFLDATFSKDGKAITDFWGTADEPAFLAIRPDDKIIFSGFAYNDSVFNLDYAVACYNQNGTLNKTFGAGGKLTGFIPGGDAIFSGTTVQPDGKVLVAVNRSPFALPGQSDFVVARYNKDGTPDVAFGEKGTVQTDFFGRNDFAVAIALLPDGKFIVAGTVRNAATDLDEFGLARYFADGTPDPSFGIKGTTTTGVGGSAEVVAVALQKDGRIVVAGTVYRLVNDYNFIVARYGKDGVLDRAFGDNGIAITNITDGWEFASSLALQPDGKIVVAGIAAGQSSGYDFAVVRYDTNGLPDPDFDGDGKVVTDFNGDDDHANAVAIQSDGKIVVAGGSFVTGSDFDLALARYNRNGTFDDSFGKNGKVTTDFPGNSTVAAAMTLQENGKIIVTGSAYDPSSGTATDVILGRYNPSGFPDSSFGTNGFVTSDFGGDDQAASIAIWENRIYVGGASRVIEREALLAAYLLASNTVSQFMLVDAGADTTLRQLTDGALIDLESITGKSINIQVNTEPAQVGSVVLTLRGRQWHNAIENIAPYALFGNTGDEYKNWKPAAGTYILTATPYSGTGGTGTAGLPLAIRFQVVDHPVLTHFTLVDAATDKNIRTLQSGDVINLSLTPDINIRANRQTLTVESVKFGVNKNANYRVQNSAPFALASDNKGDYFSWRVTPGTYTITATPYSKNGATGEEGAPLSVRVEVIAGNVAPLMDTGFSKLTTVQNIKTGTYSVETAPLLSVKESTGLYAAPNPFSTAAAIHFSVPRAGYTTLIAYDQNGVEIAKLFQGQAAGKKAYQANFTGSNLSAGVYVLRLTLAGKQVATTKVVRVR